MKKSFVVALLLVIAVSVCVSSLAQADHAAKKGRQDCQAKKQIEKRQAGVVLLDKMPYISRVFRNIGLGGEHGLRVVVAGHGHKAAKCGPRDCRKHVDIELDVVKCKSAEPACKVECKTGVESNCCQKQAAVTKRHSCRQHHEVAKKTACKCGEGCKCATAEKCAKRENHKKANKNLLEALAKAKAEIAHLRAQVELAHEKHELLQTVMTTMSENTRLKAQLELVSHRHQAEQTVARITAENSKLKARLAKLEQQVATKASEARAAAAPCETRNTQR